MSTMYVSPDGLPCLQCPGCYQSSFIHNEAAPGKRAALECSECGSAVAIGITEYRRAAVKIYHPSQDDDVTAE